MKLFENVTWPQAVIYNVTASNGSKAQGSAEVVLIKDDKSEKRKNPNSLC